MKHCGWKGVRWIGGGWYITIRHVYLFFGILDEVQEWGECSLVVVVGSRLGVIYSIVKRSHLEKVSRRTFNGQAWPSCVVGALNVERPCQIGS